jgi:hypothetical protein
MVHGLRLVHATRAPGGFILLASHWCHSASVRFSLPSLDYSLHEINSTILGFVQVSELWLVK